MVHQSQHGSTQADVVAAILRRHGRILICQRREEQRHGKCWEFPGGKREAGETEPQALVRELREELGLHLDTSHIGPLCLRLRHQYAGMPALELAFYEVCDTGQQPQNRIFAAMLWEAPERLHGYEFLAADRPVLDQLAPPGITTRHSLSLPGASPR